MRYLGPLQLLSYALEIFVSFVELQWPEFLIMCAFQLHVSMPFLYYCVRSLFAAAIPYVKLCVGTCWESQVDCMLGT